MRTLKKMDQDYKMKKDILENTEVILGANGLKFQTTRELGEIHFVFDGIIHYCDFLEIQKKFCKTIKDTKFFEPTGVYVPISCSIHYSSMDCLLDNVLNSSYVDFDFIVDGLSKKSFSELKKAIKSREDIEK